MAERVLSARTIQIHDIEANWLNATTFVPKNGEIVIYDIDDTHLVQRFKLGDGVTPINDLPFVIDRAIESFFLMKDDVIHIDAGRITDYEKS